MLRFAILALAAILVATTVFAAERPIVREVRKDKLIVRVSVAVQTGSQTQPCTNAQRQELTDKASRMLALTAPFMVADFKAKNPGPVRFGKVVELKLAGACYRDGGLGIVGVGKDSPIRLAQYQPGIGWRAAH
jgi:hypothetical protein